jgi:hypothetical protein
MINVDGGMIRAVRTPRRSLLPSRGLPGPGSLECRSNCTLARLSSTQVDICFGLPTCLDECLAPARPLARYLCSRTATEANVVQCRLVPFAEVAASGCFDSVVACIRAKLPMLRVLSVLHSPLLR